MPRSNSSSSLPTTVVGLTYLMGAGWAVFVLSTWAGSPDTHRTVPILPATLPLLALAISLLWRTRTRWHPWLATVLDTHARAIEAVPRRWVGPAIVLAACSGIFAELMMIRMHASWFQLFGYFKNVSLLSCFLGLGLGYAVAQRRLTTPLAIPMLALQSVFLFVLRLAPDAEHLQNPIREQLTLGIPQASSTWHALAVYGFLSAIFVANTLAFLPMGQVAGRLMRRLPRLSAYGWNLSGSVLGVLLFLGLSWLRTSPVEWLLVATVLLLPLIRPRRHAVVTALAGAVAALVVSIPRPDRTQIFSPYQILEVGETERGVPYLSVNNVYFQRLLDFDSMPRVTDSTGIALLHHYDVPYAFVGPDARALILGSGTGNDVAAALRNGLGSVTAVEIDPAIVDLGRRMHPSRPYDDPRVNTVIGDARNFLRRTDDRFDLIVYGLLDSHTLLAGQGGVRLDSYVYTVEGLRDARARLTEDGTVVLTFSMLHRAIGRKLYLMLTEAFDGRPPLVFQTVYDLGFTFIQGNTAPDPDRITAAFRDVTGMLADTSLHADVGTDNWPFFYMPERTYPASYVVMIGLLLFVSLVVVRTFVPHATAAPNSACFFLGAGFMLIETKSITELALVFGSTWVVTGAVITGVLVMAFLANVTVMAMPSPRPRLAYALLFASLALGALFPKAALVGLPAGLAPLVLTALLTAPLFFSGLAFSTELNRAGSVESALASNLFGAMLGGFLEYNAMYLGVGALYWIAAAVYGLAVLTTRGAPRTAPR